MHLSTFELAQVQEGWWAHTWARLGLVCVTTIGFAVLGHLVRGVTRGGAVAGAVMCFALFAAAGPGAFAGLLSVFALTWVATRIGLASKQRMGTAERREGRAVSQVLANLGIAALCAVLSVFLREPILLVAMAASLSEAAADTVSSECGQAFSSRARLITTFELVPAGTDGGITVLGTLAGAMAALLVSVVCALAGLLGPRGMLVAALAGFVGMLGDSLLGAWFERRKRMGNDAVNFVSTALAALVGFTCGYILS